MLDLVNFYIVLIIPHFLVVVANNLKRNRFNTQVHSTTVFYI